MTQTTTQPRMKIKKPPILFDKTQKVIQKIEKQLGATIFCYWSSSGGSICSNDMNAFYEILKTTGKIDRLALFIKSGGGDGQSSLRLINLIRQYASSVTALIPLESASAATMVALGADQILMGPLGYLTAIDTSLEHPLSPTNQYKRRVSVSQDELNRVVRLWSTYKGENNRNPYEALFQYVHPLVVGSIDRSESLSIKLCKEILSFHMDDSGKAEQISNYLNSSYPSHNYPITIGEAKKIGLNVDQLPTKVNDLLLELNLHYSEMGQTATTDYDEMKYHDHAILNIIEAPGVQVFYQKDEDRYYFKDENRWLSMNDHSAWHKIARVNGRMVRSLLHIS